MASVQNAGPRCRPGLARDLVERNLFMYLWRCGARDGRPVFPRLDRPSTVSFVRGGDHAFFGQRTGNERARLRVSDHPGAVRSSL